MTLFRFLQYLKSKNAILLSTEKPAEIPSGSELRRWIIKGAIQINEEIITDSNAELDSVVWDCVIHPKSSNVHEKRRCTLSSSNRPFIVGE